MYEEAYETSSKSSIFSNNAFVRIMFITAVCVIFSYEMTFYGYFAEKQYLLLLNWTRILDSILRFCGKLLSRDKNRNINSFQAIGYCC